MRQLIFPLKMKPSPWGEANQSRGEVKWGPAKLSAEVFVRKIHDRETETYSEPIGHVKTGVIDVFVQSGLPLLPEKLNILVLRFQNAIKQSDWDRALKYCSKKIKSEAEQYDSKEDFFKEVVPVKEIAGLAEFGISTTRSRNHQVIRYGCQIKLQYPEGRHSLSWDLSVLKEEPGWVIDFPVKPLDVWTKHHVLKQKEGQIDPQKSRSGFDVRLIPLTEEFVIGSPMLFRVEMKNTTNETLGYTDQPFMLNDPMVIKDPTGRNVPYIGVSYQIVIGREFVEPGQTVLLADNYDARSHYHIVKPGKYTFQFKARHNRTISSSNCVEVGIKPGGLSPLESIVEVLLPVLPEGFELRRRVMSSNEVAEQGGEAISVSLIGRRGKAEPQRAQMVRIVVLLDTDHSKVKIRRDHWPGLKFWGEWEWGPVYLKAVNVKQAWPDYKEQIRNALGI